MEKISSLHIIGSRNSGGAERFFTRLVRALNEKKLPTMTLTRPGSAVSRELSGLVDQVHISMGNVRDPFSRLRISRFIGANSFDIVQTYMGRATRLTRIPARSKSIHVSRLGGFYKLGGYRHADAWIGNTKSLCDYLISNGFTSHRVFYIPNFIEIPEKPSKSTLQKIRADLEIREDAAVILGAGRLVKKKGFSFLLESFDRLPASLNGRPIYLLLLGDGPESRSLREQSGRLKNRDRIRWAGWQDEPDPFFALADLFVCPSFHEPLGNVILEAWSNGTPVISTDTDGARELIQDGITGKIVPCGNIAALAEAMENILKQDASVTAELIQNGLSALVGAFGKESIVNSYLDIYHKLLKEGPSGL